jgi:predicted nucleic acid-binding protein
MAGLTLDSGAVIGFERGDRKVLALLKHALLSGVEVRVPVAVVAETWRGGQRSARVARLLDSVTVEDLTEEVARDAGEAIASVPSAGTIDALVMASAARRNDVVLTDDPDDLERLRARFRGVRILPISR